jgi:hypothetical protein
MAGSRYKGLRLTIRTRYQISSKPKHRKVKILIIMKCTVCAHISSKNLGIKSLLVIEGSSSTPIQGCYNVSGTKPSNKWR